MQITNAAANMPFIVPAETASQNRGQTAQQTLQLTEAALQISASDTVSLSAEAKALNNQQSRTASVTATVQNTTQVNPGLQAQNTSRNEQSTSAEPRTAQRPPSARPAPAAPAEQPAEMNTDEPAAARDTTSSPPSSSPENASVSEQPNEATADSAVLNPSPVAQTVAPQSQNTPQKPAQEAPMAAAGGMSTGKYSINLSV
ncbi:MAG: hypothetical protein AB1461_12065 [Thermodesulfobacteriota bacterium]